MKTFSFICVATKLVYAVATVVTAAYTQLRKQKQNSRLFGYTSALTESIVHSSFSCVAHRLTATCTPSSALEYQSLPIKLESSILLSQVPLAAQFKG